MDEVVAFQRLIAGEIAVFGLAWREMELAQGFFAGERLAQELRPFPFEMDPLLLSAEQSADYRDAGIGMSAAVVEIRPKHGYPPLIIAEMTGQCAPKLDDGRGRPIRPKLYP